MAAGKRAAECVYKWGSPLWTSVKAGRRLTVNCMCRMGHSRRHNYTNPLLISGSVGKLTRNDARDVASPRNPNKKHSAALKTGSDGPSSPEVLTDAWSVLISTAAGDHSHVAVPPSQPRSLAELPALWTVGKAASPVRLWMALLSFSCSQYQAM